MELNIVGRNIEITDTLRNYVEKKIGKLDRYLPTLTEGQVELARQTTRSANDRYVVQVTLHSNSTILRAEERNADVFASIDAVLDKIYRQIARYKGRTYHSQARPQGEPLPIQEPVEEVAPVIARRKRFLAQPMTEEEAIEQMELLGHDFFVFMNANSNTINVVYRRKEGNYGILEPEL